MIMSILNELKFTNQARTIVPAYRASPLDKAKNAVLANIQTQRLLVNAEINGTPVNLTKEVKSKDADGAVIKTIVNRKPRKSWWNHQGTYFVELMFANQPISVGGKSAIEAGTDLDSIHKVFNILESAVAAGELDKVLMDIKAKRKPRSKKSN